MAYFRSRKNKRRGSLPSLPASQAADLGLLVQESSPQPWVEDAVPQQPAVGDPQEDVAGFCLLPHPHKGWQLSKALRFLFHMTWLKDGGRKRGAEESQRGSEVQAEAAQRCAKLEGRAVGLPEELGTSQKGPRAGEVHSAVPLPGDGGGDEPVGGWTGRGGSVPREGGGHGGEMGQTQHLVQAGTSRDVEARTAGSSQSLGFEAEGRDAATIPQSVRQDFNPLSAEGSSGDERRRKVWEKLHHHGEDMTRWEGRSTRDLAVRLIEVILQTETEAYPMEMGNKSNRQEQGPGWTRASVGSSAEVRALVGTSEDVSTAQQHPQDLAVYRDVPVSVTESMEGDNQPEPFGDEQVWEDCDDDLPEQGGPSAHIHCLVVVGAKSEERWREEFPDVWSRYEMDCGLLSVEEEVSGGPAPFQKQPALSAEKEEAVASILRELLCEGVVVEGSSPFNSPLKLTPKRDGKMRLMLNCEAVNSATPQVVALAAQDTTKLVSTLSPKSKYFSVVDLSNSSFAIPLAEDSRARFAFTFRGQQYLFTRLPQGFHSTPAIVNQRVTRMLSQLGRGDKPWVISYIDDILIAGRSYEETRDRTRAVLELIRKTGFKAKFEKAQLVQPKVVYFGMTIGDKGREIHASRLEGIVKAPCPQDAGTLRSLFGRFVSLKDHIPGFWETAWPLHCLTKKQAKWEWGPEQEEALNRLKCAVLAAPPLRFPDKSQPFLIRLTTGKEAVGATLLQEDECGQLVPVGHSSRILKDYLQQEKVCLAAVWAVQAFESLTGSAPILIRMPHSPWKYLLRGEALRSRGTNPHPAQWTLLLVKNGAMAKDHPTDVLVPIAPSLQGLSTHIPKANVWFTASKKDCSIGFAAVNLEERWLLGCKGGSVPGAELMALKELLQHHRHSSPLYVYMSCWSLVEKLGNQRGEREWRSCGRGLWATILRWVHSNPGMLHVSYVGDDWSEDPEEKEWNLKAARRARALSGRAESSWQVWEPSKHEKQELIAQCHSCLHDGVEETLARVRQVAFWEEDHEQVSHWVQNCLQCADGAGGVLAQRTEGPWSQLLLGCVSGLTKTEGGHCSLLVVEDEFSGWVEAFPMQEKTAEEAAKVLFREVFARYGTPRIIRLPHAPEFLRDAVEQVMALERPWDIEWAGRNGPATEALQVLAWGAGKGWVKMLPLILAGIRSVRAQEAVLSPYQIGFPLEMRREREGKANPQGNDFAWLSQLQEDGAHYKHRIKTMLRNCPGRGDPSP